MSFKGPFSYYYDDDHDDDDDDNNNNNNNINNNNNNNNDNNDNNNNVGRDSSVCIVTRYRMHGPGIELRWVRDFPHPFRLDLGPTQPPLQCVLCLFLVGKSARAWR